MYLLFNYEGIRHLTSMLVFGSVLSDPLVLHKYSLIISECQKVTFLEVEAKKKLKKPKLLEIA